MKNNLPLLFVFVSAACILSAGTRTESRFQIAEKGVPCVEIIIGDNPHPALLHAARELQLGFKLVTGAEADIVRGGPRDNRKNRIFLGLIGSELIGKRPGDAEKLKDNDGFAVRHEKDALSVYASGYRGLINGVHRLLCLNTELIWPRPMKGFAVCENNPDLALTRTDLTEVPVFDIRGFGGTSDAEWQRWSSRNLNNDMFLFPLPEKFRTLQLELDPVRQFGGGHNLTRIWLPVGKYAETHPEYYAMIDGKRRAKPCSHICVSNPEMKKVFIRDALKTISGVPAGTIINIMQDDFDIGCECPACQKPVLLPDGSALARDDRAFKSTQWFLFLNEVAEAVYRKDPERKIRVFAYQGSAVPPKVKIFKTIMVNFCPVPANHKRSLLFDPSNRRWRQDVDQWAKVTDRQLFWREYWHCFKAFPHPIAENVAGDLRYLAEKRIVCGVYSEITHNWRADSDRPLVVGSWNRLDKTSEFWDMDAQEVWTLCQLMWNPFQDAAKLRDEYYERTYREAAPFMKKYHTLIRDVWNADPAAVPSCQEDQYGATACYIVNKKIDGKCRAALKDALKAVRHPVSRELVVRTMETFEKWVSNAPSIHERKVCIPKRETNEFPSFDFDSGVWKEAVSFPLFCVMGLPKTRAACQTAVKAFHDEKNLYLGIKCFDPHPETFKRYPKEKRDTWPKGEHIELFLSNKTIGYYQLAYNISGTSYDAAFVDTNWNGGWEFKIRIDKDGWSSVVRLPFSILGISKENRSVNGMIFRCRMNADAPGENSSWAGGGVHSPSTFGELFFLP